MEQSWKQAKPIFAFLLSPPLFWLVLFFLVPLGVVWLYSFGQNVSLVEIELTGTLDNYKRALEPLYLQIFLKSAVIAGAATLLCLALA